LRTDSDDRIERIWNEWEIVQKYLDESLDEADFKRVTKGDIEEENSKENGKGKGKERIGHDEVFPIKLNLPGMEGKTITGRCTKGKWRWTRLCDQPELEELTRKVLIL
jgi:hypothetical protein